MANDNTHSIYMVFLCITDWEKDRIVLQEGETSDYKWVSHEELIYMTQKEWVTKKMQKFLEGPQGKHPRLDIPNPYVNGKLFSLFITSAPP